MLQVQFSDRLLEMNRVKMTIVMEAEYISGDSTPSAFARQIVFYGETSIRLGVTSSAAWLKVGSQISPLPIDLSSGNEVGR